MFLSCTESCGESRTGGVSPLALSWPSGGTVLELLRRALSGHGLPLGDSDDGNE